MCAVLSKPVTLDGLRDLLRAHIDVGSPCMVSPDYPAGQGFFQIDLPDDPRDALGVVHHTASP